MVDLQGSAPVPACDKGLPAGRAGPLQVNYIVSGSKLQQKWTVPHSRELCESANALNVSSQLHVVLAMDKMTRRVPVHQVHQLVQTIPWSVTCASMVQPSGVWRVCSRAVSPSGPGQGQQDHSQCLVGASS